MLPGQRVLIRVFEVISLDAARAGQALLPGGPRVRGVAHVGHVLFRDDGVVRQGGAGGIAVRRLDGCEVTQRRPGWSTQPGRVRSKNGPGALRGQSLWAVNRGWRLARMTGYWSVCTLGLPGQLQCAAYSDFSARSLGLAGSLPGTYRSM